MSDQIATPSGASRAQNKSNFNPDSNTAAAQHERLLQYLQTVGSLTTIKARKCLDILHPAARVMELRRSGLNIITDWHVDHTEQGQPHRVARYVLFSGKGVEL